MCGDVANLTNHAQPENGKSAQHALGCKRLLQTHCNCYLNIIYGDASTISKCVRLSLLLGAHIVPSRDGQLQIMALLAFGSAVLAFTTRLNPFEKAVLDLYANPQ